MYPYLSISIVTLLAALGQPDLGGLHEELFDAQVTTAAVVQDFAGEEEAVCMADSGWGMRSPITSEDEEVPTRLVAIDRAEVYVCCAGMGGCDLHIGSCPSGTDQVGCPCPWPRVSGE